MSLIITVGMPGAGKSTWASENLDETVCRLERDRFRECIFGSRRAYHKSPLRHADRHDVIDAAMLATMRMWPHDRWAVTDTGLELQSVLPFIEHAAARWAIPLQLVIFDRPWDVIAHRNRTRPESDRVPHQILVERWARFHDPDAWWRQDRPNTTKEYV